MTLVNTHRSQLPDARAKLYEETVEILLWRWEDKKRTDEESRPGLRKLLSDVKRSDIDLKRCLWQLAFNVHKDSKCSDSESLADIVVLDLIKSVSSLHPDRQSGLGETSGGGYEDAGRAAA